MQEEKAFASQPPSKPKACLQSRRIEMGTYCYHVHQHGSSRYFASLFVGDIDFLNPFPTTLDKKKRSPVRRPVVNTYMRNPPSPWLSSDDEEENHSKIQC